MFQQGRKLLKELEDREEKGRLVGWEWVGGVPSSSKEEPQTESSGESGWLKPERSWCREREERGRGVQSMESRPSAGKCTRKGGRWGEECTEGRSGADGVRSKRRW